MRCLAGSRLYGDSRDPVAERRIPSLSANDSLPSIERWIFRKIISPMRRMLDEAIRQNPLSTVRCRFYRIPAKLDQ